MKQFFLEAGTFVILCIAMVVIKIIEPFAGCIEYVHRMKNRNH